MAIRLSRFFKVPAPEFHKRGVFNGFIGLDNHLFVDPKLLETSRVMELRGARHLFEEHFRKIAKLLRVSRQAGDAAWRAAVQLLTFPEENGAALGYAHSGGHGRGIGPHLANQIAKRATEIIRLGVEDPEIFELIGLFQDGFGADLLSDMTIAIARENFHAFTHRIAGELELRPTCLRQGSNGNSWVLPCGPTGKPLLLVPSKCLSELPMAMDRSEIWETAKENRELRDYINDLFARAARNQSVAKSELFKAVNKSRAWHQLVEVYRTGDASSYDFDHDPSGLFDWDEVGRAIASKYPVALHRDGQLGATVMAIIAQFKKNIEQNGLNEVLFDDSGNARVERYSQRLFYAVADAYCTANGLDLSREPNAGNGPVDFKISKGRPQRFLVELKLSRNPKLVAGFTNQLPAYEASESTKHSAYVIIRVGNAESAIKSVQKLSEQRKRQGKRSPALIVIDARKVPSASKR